jgi:flagellar FliL protein
MQFFQPLRTETTNAHRRRKLNSLAALFLLAAGCWLIGCQNGNAASTDEKAVVLTTVHLEDFVVNLADRDGRSYLRIGIDLGVENANPKTKPAQDSATVAVVRDSVISLLSTLKSDDLLTPDGKAKLKQDLIKTLNDRLPELKAKEVYFNEFVIQR